MIGSGFFANSIDRSLKVSKLNQSPSEWSELGRAFFLRVWDIGMI